MSRRSIFLFGKKVKLFVADAEYRALDLAYDSLYGEHSNPNITASDFYISGSADDPKQALTYNKTDTELQTLLAAFKNDGTALTNTNALMSSIHSEAAHHCREQKISSSIGTLDLPNLYELVVMYLEADNIDALDPTFNSNKLMGLGMNSTSGRFYSGTNSSYWSSTESANSWAWGVWYNGFLSSRTNWQTTARCVAPVKELSIA